jgi:gliding motility-associated-like protein
LKKLYIINYEKPIKVNRFLTFFISSILLSNISTAQMTVTNDGSNGDHIYLIDTILLGGGIIATNHFYSGDSLQIGYFDGSNSDLGLSSGIVLSSGDISILDPNELIEVYPLPLPDLIPDVDLLTIANSVPPLIGQNFTVSSVNDVASLEFDFIPSSENLSFRYIFGSDEYFGFENSTFNDVFGFFISGPGIVGPYASPVGFPDGSINIATFVSQEANSLGIELPITVSSICNYPDSWSGPEVYNPDLFVNNQSLEFIGAADGFTVIMTAEADVQCGELYHIRLAIGDGSDDYLNSYVFLEENSFTSPELTITNDVGQDSSYIEVGCGTLVNLTATPSEPGNYTYFWNNGETTETIEVGSGYYTVEVTSDDNCALLSDTFQVEVLNTVSLELPDDVSICSGENYQVDIISLTGVSPFNYSWSNGTTNETMTAPAGTYTLEVIDANNCTAEDQITINEVPRPTALIDGGGVICANDEEGVAIEFTFTGAPPFEFEFQNGNDIITKLSASFSMNIYTSDYGNYVLNSISDANCTGTISGMAFIDTIYLPSSSVNGGGLICEGDSALIKMEINAETPYRMFYNNGSYNIVESNLFASQIEFYESEAGSYSIDFIEDVYGCRSDVNLGIALVAFKQYKNPEINYIANPDIILCPIDPSFYFEVLTDGGVFDGRGVNSQGVFNPLDAGVGIHEITYSFPQNCNESDSINIEIGCELMLYTPNSFTPNGDGVNDIFKIDGINVIEFEISIFNRWGEKMFFSSNIDNSWNGMKNSKLVQEGIYSFQIQVLGKDGIFSKNSGTVNLMR